MDNYLSTTGTFVLLFQTMMLGAEKPRHSLAIPLHRVGSQSEINSAEMTLKTRLMEVQSLGSVALHQIHRLLTEVAHLRLMGKPHDKTHRGPLLFRRATLI